MELITMYGKICSMLKPIPEKDRTAAHEIMREDSLCDFVDFCIDKGCFSSLATDQISYYRRFILDSIALIDADPMENYYENDPEKLGQLYDAVGMTEDVCQEISSADNSSAIQKILDAIHEKMHMGYSEEQLEVDFGTIGDDEDEGYYLSKLNGWGATPITEILAHEDEVDDEVLVDELDKFPIAHCF